MLRRFFLFSCFFLLVALASCGGGGSDSSDVESFAGKIQGTDTYVFVMRDGNTVNAYACDGNDKIVNVSGWFKGSSTENSNQLSMTSETGEVLSLSFTNSTATGQLTLADKSVLPFSVPLVSGDSGLYEGKTVFKDLPVEGAWILLPDGSQRGAFRVKGTQTQLTNANIATIRAADVLQLASGADGKAETVHLYLFTAPIISSSTNLVPLTPQVSMPISQKTSAFL